MNWYKTAQPDPQKKVMFLMRGISGSGKSTRAKELGKGGAVFSTDDFFMVNGEYKYDPKQIGRAHDWNIGRVGYAAEKGISPIVVDNTNVEAWHMRPYADLAQQHGYKVEIIEPQTPWSFDAAELAKRNTHGVPLEVIQKMIDQWEPNLTVDDVLRSQGPERV